MDQGTVVEPDGPRVWTPVRLLLIALAAIAGGIVLSIALAGPARADTPGAPPEIPTSDSSLLGRVSTGVTDLTKAALAPVDGVVATVASRPAAAPAPTAVLPASTAAPISHLVATAAAVPAALDTALAQTPVASTPLWQDVVGSRPLQQAVSPFAAVLRPLASSVPPLLAPVVADLPSASSGALAATADTAAVPASVIGLGPDRLGSGGDGSARGTAGTAPAQFRHVDRPGPIPAFPLGAADGVLASVASGGGIAPAVLVAFGATLLLAARTARRRGWTLPAAPVFGTDVSPD